MYVCTYEYAARTVRTVRACEALWLPVVLWVPQFASHGVVFTQWIRRLRNKFVPRRTNALVAVFSGMNLMFTCAKKASKGRHKDTIPFPWRWREDEEDQQVEEVEDLPDQEKQPVLENRAAAVAKAAAVAAVRR
eukprot:364639-Chlamydomonas_euryale.AAC.1